MAIFAFIPARFQSSRFPGKPLAPIAGKPMIQHVWERAARCEAFTRVVVATDDQRIAACVEKFGGKAVMTDAAHRSGTDRICEAALKTGVRDEDIVVNIQGDQPLLEPTMITELIGPLLEDDTVPMSTLKWRMRDSSDIANTNHVKVVTDLNGFALYFSRHPIPFYRETDTEEIVFKHLGLYAYRMGFLVRYTRLPEGRLESAEKLEQLRALENGFKIKVTETSCNSTEVDVPEDIPKVEKHLVG